MSREPRVVAARAASVSAGYLLGSVVLGAMLSACAPPTPATASQLQRRASFDLSCPATALQIYTIDERTRGVMGCGRQLAYVETCEGGRQHACVWLADPTSGLAPTVQYLQQPTVVVAPEPSRPTQKPTKLYSLED